MDVLKKHISKRRGSTFLNLKQKNMFLYGGHEKKGGWLTLKLLSLFFVASSLMLVLGLEVIEIRLFRPPRVHILCLFTRFIRTKRVVNAIKRRRRKKGGCYECVILLQR